MGLIFGSLRIALQYSGLTILIVGLFLYSPIHDDMDEKWMARVNGGLDNIINYVGNIVEWSGNNRWPTERALLEAVASMAKGPLEEGIQDRYADFNGVNVHIFEPINKSPKSRPALIYLHGGGWTFGSSEFYRNVADVLAKKLQAVVISVNYPLTPDEKYPAQLDHVLKAVNYVHENVEKLGIDRRNIGIAGDSAGGNLAAAAALKLRDISSPVKLKYQVLIYPVVQALTLDLPSYKQNDWHVIHFVKRKSIAQYVTMYTGGDITLSKFMLAGNHSSPEIWKKYGHLVDPKLLPSQHAQKDFDTTDFEANRLVEKHNGFSQESMKVLTDPHAFPLMAKSLKNLPPAFVMTCELDLLRDEGILYAQRLKKDGVAMEHYHDKHGFHGMITLIKGPIVFQAANKAIDAIVEYVQRMNDS